MRILLPGYEGSKRILSASSWLAQKYLPKFFDIYYLNFGIFTDRLFTGTYVPLDNKQVGGSAAWSKYLYDYISLLKDRTVILALDDYLLNGSVNLPMYNQLAAKMTGKVDCARLIGASIYKNKETVDGIVYVGENEYTCTTQFCIWNRATLLDILKQTTNPWDFEITGSIIFNRSGYRLITTEEPVFHYPDYSCLSSKWDGIKTVDNKTEDIKFLKEHGYII